MKLLSSSVLILGSWNPRIFSPLWIKENIFNQDPDLPIEAMVNFEDFEHAFLYEKVLLVPKFSSLEFALQDPSEVGMQLMGLGVINAIAKLPHTPVRALGVNFSFDAGVQNDIRADNTPVFGSDFPLSQIKTTKRGDIFDINLITEISPEKQVKMTINIHYHERIDLSNNFIIDHYKKEVLEILHKIEKYGSSIK